MSASLPDILARLDADAPAAEARLIEWLRIPSISAQPAHAGDCLRAAEWVRDQLAGMGFEAGIRPTAGHPVVVAHHPGPGGNAPHLFFYGHYDVQPADPLALWTSPPFDPVVVDGPHGRRVVARGAVDDKGQTAMWLEALRAWHEVAGGPPCRVSVLIEGEEEVGSPSLDAFLAANKAELAADVAVISDTGMWDIDTPAITTRLRGMVYAQIDLKAASRDLHSGIYGGAALNPINALSRIMGGLHDENGRVQIPGFYDGVAEITNAQRVEWDGLGFDEGAFLGDIGLATPAGERGRSGLERLWARPTADLNGIWGGYTGDGSKTVIAGEAHAKLSCRLVPGQDPAKVADGIRRFVAERLPADAKAEVQIFTTTPGIEVPADSRWVGAARAALAEEYGKPAVLIGSGGSIPVVESMRRLLGLDSLLVGFGLNDDQVHSPNEKFELRCLHKGARSHARMLAAFAKG
ncbi:dipeptidase [Belnapia sp. T6]|uniref:Dipeptidase n=1 Tax=Belnapia mucosa TaxID=2804532 RepID=A0ABS1V0K0_9PROT|nr:dipeptidase [Belnapia mucosa]MBL6455231.1 dipeptidase [Belnapia mucosa]